MEKISRLATNEDINLKVAGIEAKMTAFKNDLLKEMSANNRRLTAIFFALAVLIIGLYFKK